MSQNDTVPPGGEHDDTVDPSLEELKQLETEAEELERATLDISVERGASPFAQYMRSFPNTTPLSHEEFIDIHAKWQKTQARHLFDYLVYRNMRLVVAVALRYYGYRHDLLDVVQEGTLGLMKALSLFEASRGFRFSTYASWWIRHFIARAQQNTHWPTAFRIPAHEYTFRGKIVGLVRDFEKAFGREPTNEELFVSWFSDQERAEFSEARTARLLHKIGTSRRRLHLDRSVSLEASIKGSKEDSKPRTIHDTIASLEPHADARLLISQVAAGPGGIALRIRTKAEKLPPAQQIVYYGRFIYDLTLADIGKHLHLTRERVRQLEQMIVLRFSRQLHMDYDSTLEIMIALGEMKLLNLPVTPPHVQALVLAQLEHLSAHPDADSLRSPHSKAKRTPRRRKG